MKAKVIGYDEDSRTLEIECFAPNAWPIKWPTGSKAERRQKRRNMQMQCRLRAKRWKNTVGIWHDPVVGDIAILKAVHI